jgi:hypothetical protein
VVTGRRRANEPAIQAKKAQVVRAGASGPERAASLAELRRRGVVRSNNAPAGDYAEWLVAKGLGGTLADTFSEKSWDVRLATNERVQVKTRVVSVPTRPGQLQTSPFRSWDFELAAFLLLRAEDYTVVKAALVPVAVVIEHGRWRQHVNGHRDDERQPARSTPGHRHHRPPESGSNRS